MTPAAANKCNLTPDPISGALSGPANSQTTIEIKDPTGTALFQTIDYGGTNLGKNVASVTFTILAGSKDLTYVYASPVAGDTITIGDPCGTVLDSFAADPGNPLGRNTVNGTGV
jgi:hypothetical protein